MGQTSATDRVGQLKKHVGAIHSSNALSLIERKIANALLYHAYPKLAETTEHTISISELCRLIGYTSNDSHRIKKALMSLISAVFEWNLIDNEQGKEVWNASAIIADARIDGSICTYSYSNRMRELLFHPDVYGLIDMATQSKFKSTYGLALYENCVRYQKIKQTKWIEIATFRKLMGVPINKYRIFRDFKRRVIDGAVAEVNKHANIQVNPQYKKEGNNVVAVQFLLQEKLKSDVGVSADETVPLGLLHCLQQEFAIAIKEGKQLISCYGEAYIQEKIGLIKRSSSFKQGKISNMASYLKIALRDDFQAPKEGRAVIARPAHQCASRRKVLEQQRENYRSYRLAKIKAGYDRLATATKDELDSHFKQFIQNTVYFNLFLKEGLDNILVRDQFCDFILQKRRELLTEFAIQSFEQYSQH